MHRCKYKKKRGWVPCERSYRVCYPHTSMDVVVFVNDCNHSHEEVGDYVTQQNYRWTVAQEEAVLQCVKNNTKNTLILR